MNKPQIYWQAKFLLYKSRIQFSKIYPKNLSITKKETTTTNKAMQMFAKITSLLIIGSLLLCLIVVNQEVFSLRRVNNKWSNPFFGSGELCERTCEQQGNFVCGTVFRECCQSASHCLKVNEIFPGVGLGQEFCTEKVGLNVTYHGVFGTESLVFCSKQESRTPPQNTLANSNPGPI